MSVLYLGLLWTLTIYLKNTNNLLSLQIFQLKYWQFMYHSVWYWSFILRIDILWDILIVDLIYWLKIFKNIDSINNSRMYYLRSIQTILFRLNSVPVIYIRGVVYRRIDDWTETREMRECVSTYKLHTIILKSLWTNNRNWRLN